MVEFAPETKKRPRRTRMTPKTQADRAHLQLREKILSGELAPGMKLRVEHLRDMLEIGASPLREALSRLTSEGLVVLEGQRGFRVAPISLDELKDVSRIRKLLEGEAVRIAIHNGDEAWEAAIVSAFYRLEKAETRMAEGEADFTEWEKRNREFHDAIVSAANSPWLQRLRSLVYDQHERYRRLSKRQMGRLRDVQREHREILDAVLARDVEAAVEASCRHIDNTVTGLVKLYADREGVDSGAGADGETASLVKA